MDGGDFPGICLGKDKEQHAKGFQHHIEHDGEALLLGVDIDRLSALYHVEDVLKP